MTGAELGILKGAFTRLEAWRVEATAAARDRNAADAAQWIYAASAGLNAADQLRVQFAELLDRVETLTCTWTREQKDALANDVRTLAQREQLVGRLSECAGVLHGAAERNPPWYALIAQYFGAGKDRQAAQDLLRQLDELADEMLKWVGAREKTETPTGIGEVGRAIQGADDEELAERAKVLARDALSVIDFARLREGRHLLGVLRSQVAATYGLPAPPPVEIA
jgi:hypothetical protein